MQRFLLCILCLLVASQVWAAMSSTIVCDVRTTASDSNSGWYNGSGSSPGTDYTQNDSPHVTIDGATITATVHSTTTQLNITGYTVATTDNRNSVRISGGTATAGIYEITAVDTGNNRWTLDRSAGTAAQTATGRMGGSIKSPAIAAADLASCTSGTLQVWIKNGGATAYGCGSTSNIADGRVSVGTSSFWRGYNSTQGDLSGVLWSTNMPSLKATANSTNIFTNAANDIAIENIECDGDRANRTTTAGFVGNVRWRAVNCRGKNMASASAFSNTAQGSYWFCEGSNCTASNVFNCGGMIFGCIAYSNVSSSNGFKPNICGGVVNCISYANNGAGYDLQAVMCLSGCIAYGNGSIGFNVENPNSTLTNCVSYNNTGYNYSTSTAANGATAYLFNCAGLAGGSGNFNSTQIPTANKIGFVTLTADPFVSAAGLNFALNSAAGGGALLKNLGFGSFAGSATRGYPSIGAAEPIASGGASVFAPSGVFAP